MYEFSHESLDVYRLAVEVFKEVQAMKLPSGWSWLRDQLVRASGAVVLNIAEGRSRGGDAGLHHFRIAQGSAAETCAGLDLVPSHDVTELQQKLRRVGAMLGRMLKNRPTALPA